MKKYLFLLLITTLLVGCSSEAPIPAEEPTIDPLAHEFGIDQRDFIIGVAGFSPRNFPHSSDLDWRAFFESLPKYAELFGDYVAWDNEVEGGMPKQIHTAAEITSQKNIQLLVGIGFEPNTMDEETAKNYIKENGIDFIKTAEQIAVQHKPEYLALGVEVNRFYQKSPEGFEEFLDIYHEAYDIVKSVSPETKVFPVFQLEYMKGKAKLSGRLHEEHFYIIEKFEKMDLVGFTTYPYLQYETPEAIPGDYYSSLSQYTDKPIAFTEMGWPTGSNVIQGDEEMQVAFLKRFITLTNPLDIEMMVWTWMHDTELPGPEAEAFNTVGLKKMDGTDKLLTSYWEALKTI